MDFEQRLFQFIRKNKLMAPRELVIAGVSGGADSMALLLGLASLRHDLGVQLHAAHFNHRVRSQAGADERFVIDWCRRLNIPLTVGRRRGLALKSLSEDDARKMRFEFFVKTAGRLGAQKVALAHTRNDMAETVLMRLMRGSGLYGLRAILPQRSIARVVFVRPLIDVDRAKVEDYLKAKQVPFCTDATNFQTNYRRNKIRHKLLPQLAREYNPQITAVLSDLAATAGEDYDFLSSHARKVFEKKGRVRGNKVRMDLEVLRRRHPAIVRLMLRQMVEGLTGDPAVLGFEHIHALENLVAQTKTGQLDLPGRLKASKTRRFLVITYV
ncbi:MAG: tRNA lysidine(34) synthetase TilS [Candidatus Omnitrophica bacterium]|nr:tRNA lysidine(34) synthetase TilS [Candidatus Omnitrophota bacterium]MDE2008885.1 tRNA lysidine(34) synthetase TilS [Candidatus Omnitrophota bacterium]MDE2213552.1 tRNA lysidine(34) synthetase TilS [Candidatus Omnitrophota bacterium]MDE2230547.1 tRNA lysidine(34) synthetase TilS [Candidatus Omnitrophota bacterium]